MKCRAFEEFKSQCSSEVLSQVLCCGIAIGHKIPGTAKKILSFIYPIYNHNWRNISTIYIYIYKTRLSANEIFSPSNKIHRGVGRAKDLSAPLYSVQQAGSAGIIGLYH